MGYRLEGRPRLSQALSFSWGESANHQGRQPHVWVRDDAGQVLPVTGKVTGKVTGVSSFCLGPGGSLSAVCQG